MSHPPHDSCPASPAPAARRRSTHTTALRRLGARHAVALVAALALPLGFAACGRTSHPTNVDSEAEYVDAGPLTYQVQISRELNPYSTEDREYLSSVPAKQLKLSGSQLWFAVFLWAKNFTHRAQTTTDSFDIVDTQGNKYYPFTLNPAVNPFAWSPQTLQPLAQEPALDSTAYFGPTQGDELLFKLNTSVYDNRPLTLEIYPPGQSRPSTVSLDL